MRFCRWFRRRCVIIPAVLCAVGKIVVNNTRLKFWDLGGQHELQPLWKQYYAECHGIMFVVDSTDHARLDECRKIFGSFSSFLFLLVARLGSMAGQRVCFIFENAQRACF